MTAGVPDALFWRLMPVELVTLLERMGKRRQAEERAATLRAGLVTSAVYNVHRKKGARALRPEDFVQQPIKMLTGEEMAAVFRDWAAGVNEEHDA